MNEEKILSKVTQTVINTPADKWIVNEKLAPEQFIQLLHNIKWIKEEKKYYPRGYKIWGFDQKFRVDVIIQ